MKHNLNILYYNAARSLIPKLDELRLECVNRQPDIVCIVETWLDDTVSDNELLLPDYQIYRYDRNRHGGGVAIYVHISLSCKIVLEGGPHKLILSDSFSGKFCISLFIVLHPILFVFFDNLCDPASFSSVFLLGDFNVNCLNTEHSLFSYVSDVLYSFSLTQVVPSHTHVSPNGNVSLIDLAMLSDIKHLQFCTTVPPLSTSDHLGVSLALK